jgi:2-haloacid dehalogenase
VPDTLNAAWERLDPWPDVVPGLRALKAHHIIAPCSNGSIALMTRLAKYGGLPWDCILGAELARDYKPKPARLPRLLRGASARPRPRS